MITPQLNNRPGAKGFTLRYITARSCIHVDTYLYEYTNRHLKVLARYTESGKTNLASHWYALARDMFGLWYSEPCEGDDTGARVNLAQVAWLTDPERRQLFEHCIYPLGCLALPQYPRTSVLHHMATPRPFDPCNGLRNMYEETGLAERNAKLRSAALLRSRK